MIIEGPDGGGLTMPANTTHKGTRYTPGPYEIGTEETPWTCGDAAVAIEHGEELGHTEILFPITAGDETIAYMPWEPLAGSERQAELRGNARLIAAAPELAEALTFALSVLHDIADEAGDIPLWNDGGAGRVCCQQARALLARIDGNNQ